MWYQKIHFRKPITTFLRLLLNNAVENKPIHIASLESLLLWTTRNLKDKNRPNCTMLLVVLSSNQFNKKLQPPLYVFTIFSSIELNDGIDCWLLGCRGHFLWKFFEISARFVGCSHAYFIHVHACQIPGWISHCNIISFFPLEKATNSSPGVLLCPATVKYTISFSKTSPFHTVIPWALGIVVKIQTRSGISNAE